MADQAHTPDETDAAASVDTDDFEPRAIVEDHVETVSVRRVPKYSVFLAGGAILGIVVAMILTFAFSGTADVSPNTGLVYSQTQVFGFVALISITVGVVLGGLVALVFDRVLARRTREVTVDRETVRIED